MHRTTNMATKSFITFMTLLLTVSSKELWDCKQHFDHPQGQKHQGHLFKVHHPSHVEDSKGIIRVYKSSPFIEVCVESSIKTSPFTKVILKAMTPVDDKPHGCFKPLIQQKSTVVNTCKRDSVADCGIADHFGHQGEPMNKFCVKHDLSSLVSINLCPLPMMYQAFVATSDNKYSIIHSSLLKLRLLNSKDDMGECFSLSTAWKTKNEKDDTKSGKESQKLKGDEGECVPPHCDKKEAAELPPPPDMYEGRQQPPAESKPTIDPRESDKIREQEEDKERKDADAKDAEGDKEDADEEKLKTISLQVESLAEKEAEKRRQKELQDEIKYSETDFDKQEEEVEKKRLEQIRKEEEEQEQMLAEEERLRKERMNWEMRDKEEHDRLKNETPKTIVIPVKPMTKDEPEKKKSSVASANSFSMFLFIIPILVFINFIN